MNDRLHLIATIGRRTVAIASAQVDSVVDIAAVTSVPRSAPEVRGLAALRSHVVTVIDTCTALGLQQASHAGRAVIVRQDGHAYAFLVDALADVDEFVVSPLVNGLALDGAWAAIAQGIVDCHGEPVLVVDLTRLIPDGAAIAA